MTPGDGLARPAFIASVTSAVASVAMLLFLLLGLLTASPQDMVEIRGEVIDLRDDMIRRFDATNQRLDTSTSALTPQINASTAWNTDPVYPSPPRRRPTRSPMMT